MTKPVSIILRLVPVLLIMLSTARLYAQNHPSKGGISPPAKLVTPSDSLQYTLGVFLGQWIVNNGFSVSQPILFNKGMEDVLRNRTLVIPAAQVAERLDTYQKRMSFERSDLQEKQLFESLKKQSGIGTLPNGVAYRILKNGTGIRPQVMDSAVIQIKGYLPDGKLFEDTYAKKKPLSGQLSTFIPGIKEVLQIMPSGATWRVFIPSVLGYGERGIPGSVPPYSALIFDIELLNVLIDAKR